MLMNPTLGRQATSGGAGWLTGVRIEMEANINAINFSEGISAFAGKLKCTSRSNVLGHDSHVPTYLPV
jgi:hypothetical protein